MEKRFDFMEIFNHDPQFRGLMKRLFEIAITESFNAIMITENRRGYPIVFINQAFTEMTGYHLADLAGKSPSLLQGPRTDPVVLERLRKDLEEGRIFHGRAVNYRKDGSEFLMEWKIAPVRNENEVVTHFMAIQRDVTAMAETV
jgi:PAS domain S-box-containing protein